MNTEIYQTGKTPKWRAWTVLQLLRLASRLLPGWSIFALSPEATAAFERQQNDLYQRALLAELPEDTVAN